MIDRISIAMLYLYATTSHDDEGLCNLDYLIIIIIKVYLSYSLHSCM
jgi:hypothetical protein